MLYIFYVDIRAANYTCNSVWVKTRLTSSHDAKVSCGMEVPQGNGKIIQRHKFPLLTCRVQVSRLYLHVEYTLHAHFAIVEDMT